MRLSQCMIVKNEERNIRRALAWAGGQAFEQIVVDTGSSDNTVKIAEELGAKVYRLEWTDDFAAAKNFALEKASGDWIAFLDADEYFRPEDAAGLFRLLESLEKEPESRKPDLIRCAWLHLDDGGRVFATDTQDRIFRNSPDIRYRNRIHEVLCHAKKPQLSCRHAEKELSICHTGYSSRTYQNTGKLERNIRILSEALRENEAWYEGWSYLGNSYVLTGDFLKAKDAYEKVISNFDLDIDQTHKLTTLTNLIKICTVDGTVCEYEAVLSCYRSYLKLGTVYPDADYWMGIYLLQHQRVEKGIALLEKSLKELESYGGDAVLGLPGQLDTAYLMLMKAYREVGNPVQAVRCGILSLRANPGQEETLAILLEVFKDAGEKAENVLGLLEKLYGLTRKPEDRIFVLRAAAKSGFRELERRVLDLCTGKEKEKLSGTSLAPWYLTKRQCSLKYPQIVCLNETDRAFCILMEKLSVCSRAELLESLRKNLCILRNDYTDAYMKLVSLGKSAAHWGKLDWQDTQGDQQTRRIDALLLHRKELVNLYGRLGDNRSKKVLLAVVNNWMSGDMRLLGRAADREPCCFDTDLIPSAEEEIFVDVGAGEGRSALAFMETYGDGWKEIYCYEPASPSFAKLEMTLAGKAGIVMRHCMAGSETGCAPVQYCKENTEEICVEPSETVLLDEDIREKITFLKVDAYGAEESALEGCRRHITQERPKLAVCVHYGFDEICRIPELILEMDPSYRLYLRYYGQDCFPTNVILYAL